MADSNRPAVPEEPVGALDQLTKLGRRPTHGEAALVNSGALRPPAIPYGVTRELTTAISNEQLPVLLTRTYREIFWEVSRCREREAIRPKSRQIIKKFTCLLRKSRYAARLTQTS